MLMFRPLFVSRNGGEEAIQQEVELLVPLPVETMSGIFQPNRAAVPEVPKSQAVYVIEIDHGVVGTVDDGQRNGRSLYKGALVEMPAGKGSIDHQLPRTPICPSDGGFPERIVDGVRSEGECDDHVYFLLSQGLFSGVGKFRIGNEAERCTFWPRWDWW